MHLIEAHKTEGRFSLHSSNDGGDGFFFLFSPFTFAASAYRIYRNESKLDKKAEA